MKNKIVKKLIQELPPMITLRDLERLTNGVFKYNTLKMKTYPPEIYTKMGRVKYFDTELLLEYLFNGNCEL